MSGGPEADIEPYSLPMDSTVRSLLPHIRPQIPYISDLESFYTTELAGTGSIAEHVKIPQNYVELLLYSLIHVRSITYVSSRFRELFRDLEPQYMLITQRIDSYLRASNVNVLKYVWDVYDLGEGDFSELKPYIEVYVDTRDVNEMLNIWRNVIEYIRAQFGDQLLDNVDIFFTRA